MNNRDELVENLFLDLQATQRAWKKCFQEVLGAEQVTLGQMRLLLYLKTSGAVTNKQIAADLFASKSSIAQLIDSLEAAGYIARHNDKDDRRVFHVVLSAAGRDKVEQLDARRRDFFVRMTHSLTNEEIQFMTQVQKKIVRHIERREGTDGCNE